MLEDDPVYYNVENTQKKIVGMTGRGESAEDRECNGGNPEYATASLSPQWTPQMLINPAHHHVLGATVNATKSKCSLSIATGLVNTSISSTMVDNQLFIICLFWFVGLAVHLRSIMMATTTIIK